MKFGSRATALLAFAAPILAKDNRIFQAESLQTCKGWDDGVVSVNLFEVEFRPGESKALVDIYAQFRHSGKITLDLQLLVYGYQLLQKTIDPCDFNVPTLCPVKLATPLELNNQKLPIDAKSINIPGELGDSRFLRTCGSDD